MKHFLTSAILLLNVISSNLWACDDLLKPFPRDCQIQDEFRQIKSQYAVQNIDVNYVYEYRLLRFIDRDSYEKSLVMQVPVEKIYSPSPDTWNYWSLNIDQIMGRDFHKVFFLQKSNAVGGTRVSFSAVHEMNTKLIFPKKSEPRKIGDLAVGFCLPQALLEGDVLNSVDQSFDRFQKKLEYQYQFYFSDLAQQSDVLQGRQFKVGAALKKYDQIGQLCPRNDKGQQSWVSYPESLKVDAYLHWIEFFLETQMDLIEQKKSVLSPIELAAFVQKWFVTVHPFQDGNGRTSRAIQDLILQYYGLPFAPAGDLQNDLLITVDMYLQQNYLAMEDSMATLRACLNQETDAIRCQLVH